MPVEIRELVIKATIDESAPQQSSTSSGNGGTAKVDDTAVQKIIDQVLSKLRNINER